MNSSTYGEKLWSSGNNSGESCYVTEVRPKEETYPAQPHTRQLVKVMRYALPCLTVKLEAVDGEIKLLLPASFAVIDVYLQHMYKNYYVITKICRAEMAAERCRY